MNGSQGFPMLDDVHTVNPIISIEKKEKKKKYFQEWRLQNNERVVFLRKRWKKEHPEIVKQSCKKYYAKYPEKVKKANNLWRVNHPDKVKKINKKARIKLQSTPQGKLNKNIRGIVGRSLHGLKNRRNWELLVGYTSEQLKTHLETLFTNGMTWKNYGTYWEVDHKIPIAVFNYEKPEDIDFKKCWALKNLQPLESVKNRLKNKKINKPFQPSLLIEE
jgi:5-methylcytosine-specific restriction endonuclease McrA